MTEAKQADARRPWSAWKICVLIVASILFYALSIPFFYLLLFSLPESVGDFLLPTLHIYDPLEWLYLNVGWVKEFYDWYEQFFPWWQ